MMEIVENGYIDWRQETATLVLRPANPAFRTQIYTGEELNQIRVLGMTVVLQKNLANKKDQGAIPGCEP